MFYSTITNLTELIHGILKFQLIYSTFILQASMITKTAVNICIIIPKKGIHPRALPTTPKILPVIGKFSFLDKTKLRKRLTKGGILWRY